MLNNITFYPVFGLPLIAYGGMITLISFLFTASIPFLNKKKKISIKWHFRMARISLALAFIHGLLAALSFL